MWIPVETLYNWIESFLTRSIPKLEFDINILVDFDYFGVILNTQCDGVMIQKLVC